MGDDDAGAMEEEARRKSIEEGRRQSLEEHSRRSLEEGLESPMRGHLTSQTSSQSLLPSVPSSRVDRLLLQRLRKTQSNPALYGEPGGSQLPHIDDEHESCVLPPLEDEGQQRLIVIANRLPVSAYKTKDGKWATQASAGGLVSALMGVGNFHTTWIGWPGMYVEEGPNRDALVAVLKREGYVPVFLEPALQDLHYNGFCNSVLWQLFHYVPLNIDSKLSETQTLQVQWQAHQEANRRFAEVVMRHYQDGDVVWVQDYHLMLLPELLKMRKPKMKVGWFLHTPFPSSEIYRTLPVREEVLRAVLRADLIGFHTYDYARHFVSACTRILGLEGTPEGVEDNGTLTRIAAFPIGIDPERFTRAMEAEEVKKNMQLLRKQYGGRKVMLGVDRLDMIKGIPQKLLAFEKFLEDHPEWKDKVVLVQIAVPTRTEVREYQQLRSIVHEIVGRINGKFSGLCQVPIIHLDRQLGFHELCALYGVTDVLLVTSLRDGMNLVSYEFVACQGTGGNLPGVLILSEFAGAAQSLGAGAVLVNPWNVTDLAAAIEDALLMSEEERQERHRQNYMHVSIHTAQTWADTFISELNDTHVESELRSQHIPPQLDMDRCVNDYRRSQRRLLVLGYNATLTTAVEAPRHPKRHFDSIKGMTKINPATLEAIRCISSDPRTTVVIFSGSDKTKLEELFGTMDVWMAAENGVFYKPPPKKGRAQEWANTVDTSNKVWMEAVQLVVDYFSERTPRSFVETRETSVVWNYKYADVEFGRLQARDLLQHLWTGPISNAPVDIVQGSKSVEVRPVGVTKGMCMERLLSIMAERLGGPEALAYDFVLVSGHFLARDENIFTLFEGVVHKVGSSGSLLSASTVGMMDPTQGSGGHGAGSVGTSVGGGGGGGGGGGSALSSHHQSTASLGILEQFAGVSMDDPGPFGAMDAAPPSMRLGGGGEPLTPRSQQQPNHIYPGCRQQQQYHASPSNRSLGPLPPFVVGASTGVSTPGSRLGPSSVRSGAFHGRQLSSTLSSLFEGVGTAGGAAGGASGPAVLFGSGSFSNMMGTGLGGGGSLGGGGMGGMHGPMGGGGMDVMPAPLPMQLPPKHLYTTTVGRGKSQARYFLNSSSDVGFLLQQLCCVHRGLPTGSAAAAAASGAPVATAGRPPRSASAGNLSSMQWQQLSTRRKVMSESLPPPSEPEPNIYKSSLTDR